MQYRNVFDVLSHYQRPEGYDDEITMGEMLKEAGHDYATAMFGKGASAVGRFEDAGYDITDELPGEPGGNGNGHGSYWNPKTKTTFPPDNPKRIHSLRKDSVAFVEEYAGKQPFFVMINHYAPHIPHMATKEAFDRNKKRWIEQGRDTKDIDAEKSSVHRDITYAAMIEEMDMNVSALIDALEAKGELITRTSSSRPTMAAVIRNDAKSKVRNIALTGHSRKASVRSMRADPRAHGHFRARNQSWIPVRCAGGSVGFSADLHDLSRQ